MFKTAPFAVLAALVPLGPVLHVAAQSKAAAPKNLLTNPGFEKGSGGVPDSWDQSVLPPNASLDGVVDYIWHASVAHTGKRSLCFKKTDNRFFPVAQWRQQVSYSSGKDLAFSVWIKTREAGKATLTLQFNDASGNALGRHFAAFVGGQDGSGRVTQDWKRYAGTVPVPSGTAAVVVIPEMYGPGVAWFDDIDIHEAP